MNSFISTKKLNSLGFKKIGNNVFISKKASFYDYNKISIGSNVRIDDFCILSGNITIGNNVHISAGTLMYAGDSSIEIGNHSSISSRCGIYAISDDFSGRFLVGSMEEDKYRNIVKKNLVIGDYVVVGTGSTVLPGARIPDGVAIGAMSFVNKPLKEWCIYCGVPCSMIKERDRSLLGIIDEN